MIDKIVYCDSSIYCVISACVPVSLNRSVDVCDTKQECENSCVCTTCSPSLSPTNEPTTPIGDIGVTLEPTVSPVLDATIIETDTDDNESDGLIGDILANKNNMLYICIGGLTFVLLIIAMLFVLLCRKKNKVCVLLPIFVYVHLVIIFIVQIKNENRNEETTLNCHFKTKW